MLPHLQDDFTMHMDTEAMVIKPTLQEFAPIHPLLTVAIRSELDVIASRLRARQISALCGFGNHEQTRFATAVSELARNAFAYASGGKVAFLVGQLGERQALVIAVEDQGTGIAGLERILANDADAHGAQRGGLQAARRLMDRCDIVTGSEGTRIVLAKACPANMPPLDAADIDAAMAQLDALPSNVALSEAHQQNRELTDALAALQAKQLELLEVSACLERTNRQVEALNVLLREKASSLASADRRKDEFLSILSHELRSPLSAASMAAHLLQNSPESGSQGIKLGQLIGRQTQHMSRLVEDLLDVSRVSRGLVSISRTAVDMREVLDAAIEQHAAAARAKGHAVHQRVAPRACTVDGDLTRLVQIVTNLLGNAIRYTPDGGRIELSLEAHEGWLVLRVSDNGIGIPPALMPHLFDLYTQAERSADARNSGLGLGLALVKSLVEAHGGSVAASSEGAGRGSQFEVRLLLSDSQIQADMM
jgi:signal transduction histidine kinase